MKMIMALIEPQKFPEVRQALFDIDVRGMTLSSAMGCSREVGFKETYRGVVSVIGTLAAAFITRALVGLRVPTSAEQLGMDITEHGEEALRRFPDRV